VVGRGPRDESFYVADAGTAAALKATTMPQHQWQISTAMGIIILVTRNKKILYLIFWNIKIIICDKNNCHFLFRATGFFFDS
jgi:hypothetical protein